MLIPVLHVCAKDESLALGVLEATLALESGKPIEAHLILSHERGFDASAVLATAQRAFTRVSTLQYDPWTGDKMWPVIQNRAWQNTARALHERRQELKSPAWFWWEADACPLQPGWLATLARAYTAKPFARFAGAACKDHVTDFYMNGVGIWPMDIIDALANSAALYATNAPFDRIAGPVVRSNFKDLSHLIIHHRKTHGGDVGRTFSTNELASLRTTHPEAVFFHGSADGSLARVVSETAGGGVTAYASPASPAARDLRFNAFYHSGDLGDVIHSLWAAKLLGGGSFYLGPDQRVAGVYAGTRVRMDEGHARLVLPLIAAQDYITHAAFSARMKPETTHDFNQFRPFFWGDGFEATMRKGGAKEPFSIARAMCALYGLHHLDETEPWLTVPNPRPVPDHPIIVNVTPRYRNPEFDWNLVAKRYGKRLLFIGLKDEHALFHHLTGIWPEWIETRNLLEAAELIAGCELYIGNQSSPCAIAEGLKKPLIQATCTTASTAVFDRPNAVYMHGALTEQHLEQVDLIRSIKATPKPKPTRALYLRCPVDAFSGFGQICSTIALGLKARGHAIRIVPSIFQKPKFQADITPVAQEMIDLIVDEGNPAEVIIETHCGLPHWIKGGETVMTMWESTRMGPATRDALNRTKRVMVPSIWNATLFNACGVNTPFSLVPLGIDPEVYKPQPWRKDSLIVFGTAGRWQHGGCRKGLEDTVQAFLRAFPNEQNVRLHVKCFADCQVNAPDDPRIILDRRFYPSLTEWYAGLTCFVTASRGEGWGLHPHQAMACARPVIATRFGGIAEFFDASCGWPLDFEFGPARDYYQGKGIWAEPSEDHLVELMRYVAAHPKEAKERGAYAAKRAATFTNDRMISAFETVLKKMNHL